MARGPVQPIEITVRANLAHPFAKLSWSFVRLQVMHKFDAIVVQDDRDKSVSFRDDSFTMSYPVSIKQREEFKRKNPTSELITSHEKKIKVNTASYKDMILSIRALLKMKPLIDDARTSVSGVVSIRYPEFVYPTWYRRRDNNVYDPRLVRGVPAPLPATVNANGLNGPDVTAMPVPFTPPPPPPLLALIEQYTPLVPPKTYQTGITDSMNVVEGMRTELSRTMENMDTPGQAIIKGYVAILDEAMKRIARLT